MILPIVISKAKIPLLMVSSQKITIYVNDTPNLMCCLVETELENFFTIVGSQAAKTETGAGGLTPWQIMLISNLLLW